MTQYAVVGLGTMIDLPVPLVHDIIPASQTNQRPGIARQMPGYWVAHETDNHARGADAAMHARYLNAGAEGRQASWHFTADDGVIYQHIPIDEVTWQAADGAGPGNMSGISCELCVNAGIDVAKSRHNAEALAGGIMKALHMGAERTKRHWDFNEGSRDRHHCPDTIMNDNYWPTFVANVGAIIAASPPIEPHTPKAAGIWWEEGDTGEQVRPDGVKALAMLGEVTVTNSRGCKVRASVDGKELGKLTVGTKATIYGTHVQAKRTVDGRLSRSVWAFCKIEGYEGYPRIPLVHLGPKWPAL